MKQLPHEALIASKGIDVNTLPPTVKAAVTSFDKPKQEIDALPNGINKNNKIKKLTSLSEKLANDITEELADVQKAADDKAAAEARLLADSEKLIADQAEEEKRKAAEEKKKKGSGWGFVFGGLLTIGAVFVGIKLFEQK